MNTKTFSWLGVLMMAVVATLMSSSGVRGDDLFSICAVEDNEPELDYQLMAFSNPQPAVCDWPRFAGGVDAYVTDGYNFLYYLAGLHVQYRDGYLYGSGLPHFWDPAFEYLYDKKDATEATTLTNKRNIVKRNTEGDFLGEFGSWNGGQTILRKWTRYSPNGRVDFSGGHIDTLYSTVIGPALTGDCNGNFYTFDQTTGFISTFTAGGGKTNQYSLPLASPGYGFNVDDDYDWENEILGLTYNPVDKKFYTAYVGELYNNTVLFVTSLDPKTSQSQTFWIGEFTLFDSGAWAAYDGLEAASDGTSLWLLVVDYPCTSRSDSAQRSGRRTASKRCSSKRASPELDAAYEHEVNTRKTEGRTPPTLISQFYKIDLLGQTIYPASEPYYGVDCAGLTQIHSVCSRQRTRSEALSFEAVLGKPESQVPKAPTLNPVKRAIGVRS